MFVLSYLHARDIFLGVLVLPSGRPPVSTVCVSHLVSISEQFLHFNTLLQAVFLLSILVPLLENGCDIVMHCNRFINLKYTDKSEASNLSYLPIILQWVLRLEDVDRRHTILQCKQKAESEYIPAPSSLLQRRYFNIGPTAMTRSIYKVTVTE